MQLCCRTLPSCRPRAVLHSLYAILTRLALVFLGFASVYFVLAVYVHHFPPIHRGYDSPDSSFADRRFHDGYSVGGELPVGSEKRIDVDEVAYPTKARFQYRRENRFGLWFWEPWRLARDRGIYNTQYGIVEVLFGSKRAEGYGGEEESDGSGRRVRLDTLMLRHLEGSTVRPVYDLYPELRPKACLP